MDMTANRVRSVYEFVRNEMLSNRLAPGDKLPASRALAKTLRVSRNAVVAAYEILISEGLVFGRTGSGTFVSGQSRQELGATTASPLKGLSAWASALPQQPGVLPTDRYRIDFRPGLPSKDGLKSSASHMRRALLRIARLDIQSPDFDAAAGQLRIRQLISNHLRKAFGVACQSEDLILTGGTQQSLDLIARVFSCGQTTVAVEDPGYPIAWQILGACGFRLVPVPVDHYGIVVSKIPAEARLVYTTPNNQLPLGQTLSPERRAALLRFAKERDAFIIEDDYDGELRPLGTGRLPLKAVDEAGRVIYLSSVSKYLSSQFRFGYICAPPSIKNILHRAKLLTDRQIALPVQLIVESLLAEGVLLRITRRLETDYSRRHEILRNAVRSQLGDWFDVPAQAVGMHLTAIASGAVDVEALSARAAAMNVGIYSLQRFCMAAQTKGLVFGLASLTPNEIQEGVQIIRELLLNSCPHQ